MATIMGFRETFCRLGTIKEKVEDWKWTRHRERTLDVYMTQLRLGGAKLYKYLYKIKAVNTNICPFCPLQEYESVSHFLLRCPAYQQQRDTLKNNLERYGINELTKKLLLGGSTYEIKVKNLITKELISFLKTSGRI